MLLGANLALEIAHTTGQRRIADERVDKDSDPYQAERSHHTAQQPKPRPAFAGWIEKYERMGIHKKSAECLRE
jgi:hypothetical protein